MNDGELDTHLTCKLPQYLQGLVRGWLAQSHSFRTFALANVRKILSKIEGAKGDEDKADVVAELDVANAMLAAPFFSLTYEPYGRSGLRNPDFLVDSEGLDSFHLEVKRIREPTAALNASATAMETGDCVPCWEIPYTQKEWRKFSDHLLGCLEQLRPNSANILAIVIHSSTHEPIEMGEALYHLREADGADSYLKSKGFSGREEFLQQMRTLSAVVVLSIWKPIRREPRNYVWENDDSECRLPSSCVEHLRMM